MDSTRSTLLKQNSLFNYQKKKSTSNTGEHRKRLENHCDGRSSQLILRYILHGIYYKQFKLHRNYLRTKQEYLRRMPCFFQLYLSRAVQAPPTTDPYFE